MKTMINLNKIDLTYLETYKIKNDTMEVLSLCHGKTDEMKSKNFIKSFNNAYKKFDEKEYSFLEFKDSFFSYGECYDILLKEIKQVNKEYDLSLLSPGTVKTEKDYNDYKEYQTSKLNELLSSEKKKYEDKTKKWEKTITRKENKKTITEPTTDFKTWESFKLKQLDEKLKKAVKDNFKV